MEGRSTPSCDDLVYSNPFSESTIRLDASDVTLGASSVTRSNPFSPAASASQLSETVSQEEIQTSLRPAEASSDGTAASSRITLALPGPGPQTLSEKQGIVVESQSLHGTKEKPSDAAKDAKPGLWRRFVNEYRKNYCPRESPPLVLPTAPDDKEKYSYVNMNRWPVTIAGTISLLALGAGAWLFVKASPWFSWFALYAVLSQGYLIMSYAITILGKPFNLDEHKKVLAEHLLLRDTAPSVDIYLPICKEPLEILENTWRHVSAIRYPDGKLSIWVLDDGADEGAKNLAQRMGLNYIVRDNRPELKKAGNLRNAFARTSGDFFVVFDADFCPRADFLQELVPRHMADEKLAIVQTPQYFRASGNQTWTEQGAGDVQEYFYRIVQTCRDTWGGAICVGSNAVYRRAALEAVGGTAPADCSEDVHTGFYALTRGWKVKYMPLVLACGVCPDTPRAFFSQQMRWCTGSMSLLTHSDFWKSNLSVAQKFCYLSGFLYYTTSALASFFNPVPAPILLWSYPEYFKYYNVFFAFPSLLLGLVALRLWSRSRHTLSVQYVQMVMAYAHLHAIWDRFFGTKMAWLPSGDSKVHKNNRYRNMRILCWAWTIAHNTVLITGVVYRLVGGMAWYHVIPALVLDFYNFLTIHRFLFYRHARD